MFLFQNSGYMEGSRRKLHHAGDFTSDDPEENIPLVSSDDELAYFSEPKDQYSTRSPRISLLTFCSTAFCVLTACLSILILILNSPVPSKDNLSLYDLQSSEYSGMLRGVRRPSQFMGLDKINRTADHALSIVNLPFLIGRVDKGQPRLVNADGSRGRMEINGNVARKIEITRDFSTVVQFRAIDWNLDMCELHLRLGNEHTGSGVINVFRIISNDVLDLKSLSFASLPSTDNKVGTVEVSPGSERISGWSYSFGCETDSIHTFILAAAAENTNVQWWQDHSIDHTSLYITQRGF
ncbi:hypothetical protein K435DRAFT_383061 [Dendrothele bispora CBS 962.96]|uniref:Ubiquitin 3 binding protein But2 C-terminal domain-containing protein n=1 Tax=Dendrothele bispora (strain CBS 962.96) TaxID=1314807 RepID=A0A4V4HIM8_DENBC|nr:hypothetical protein K435DRAFT_383061 [Dendrothele bispora CBS 962.96]